MTPTATRDRLKDVRAQIEEAKTKRADARRERDEAKAAFENAQHEGPVTKWPEFAAAQDKVKSLGEIDDSLADLRVAESGLLQLLGEDSPADRDGDKRGRATDAAVDAAVAWNAHRLLAAEGSAYLEAKARGVFQSTNKFGTVVLGELASRERMAEFINRPMAAPIDNATVGGMIQPDRRGVQPLVMRPLRLLDLIPTGTTDSNSIEYVQVVTLPTGAVEVVPGAVKPEEALGTLDATAPVRTIAGWVKILRQTLDDTAGLASLINTVLPYDVRRRLENQIIAGDGTGQNLRGILNTSGLGAPAFVAGDNIADAILRAMTTVILSDAEPNFAGLHPLSWQSALMLREDNTNRTGTYLLGGPASMAAPTLWGLALTPSVVVPQATPLVGDSNAMTLLVREGVNVKVSDSDQDDFVRNRVTVLAEGRFALPIWRPASFAIADTTP